ncbi:MAG: RloB domain-containing protein [Actinomycetaceae bacterium]|nr:RloB domain-containing protein [Actinomycetaceae bacterium]
MSAKKRSRKPRSRRSAAVGFRVPREPVYLCAEGQTEIQYVRALFEYRYPGLFTLSIIRTRGKRAGGKTSLLNLIEVARKESKTWARREKSSRDIWIICDLDENAHHREALEKWLNESPNTHHAVIQAASIEAWFLSHFDNPQRPRGNREAEELLAKQWKNYRKGAEIPRGLIDRTDEAVSRELNAMNNAESQWPFPPPGCSQMPDFIEYLDERASKLGGQH